MSCIILTLIRCQIILLSDVSELSVLRHLADHMHTIGATFALRELFLPFGLHVFFVATCNNGNQNNEIRVDNLV